MSSQIKAVIQSFLPILVLFIVISSFAIVFVTTLRKLNIDQSMVITGNVILFSVTALSYFLYRKALLAGNTQVFLRNVYSGMFIKFFVCLIAAFVYIFTVGNEVNKPGLFILMFLYLLYTFIEIAILLNQSKLIKHNSNV
ncbi:MAG: hypothetical protein WKF89_01675 [Chitinophagaceae bacterium]